MRFLVLALVVAFAGCVRSEPMVSERPRITADYREFIRNWAYTTLRDPYSLRSVGLSEPVPWGAGWLVCFRFNAKNGFGAYQGVDEVGFLVVGDRVLQGWRSGSGLTNLTCQQAAPRYRNWSID